MMKVCRNRAFPIVVTVGLTTEMACVERSLRSDPSARHPYFRVKRHHCGDLVHASVLSRDVFTVRRG